MGIVQICKGEYYWLEPVNAFEPFQDYDVGLIALAFLQGSFAYGGWNFLNYVTEELVDPYESSTCHLHLHPPCDLRLRLRQHRLRHGYESPGAACLKRCCCGESWVSIELACSVLDHFSSCCPLVIFVGHCTCQIYDCTLKPKLSVPLSQTFGEKLLGVMAWIMPISVALSTFGGVNGSLFTSSRLFFAGAREGHLPSLLAMIHVKRCTPIPALLFTCLSTLLMLCTSDMYTLINYVGFINYLFYGVTVAGQIVLRVKQPNMHRPIKVCS
ncbi:Large neutral amino acids transporter small subunit 2 [Goodea atripinnis]|uniref:Large neutral amino acids transporter small subunit 2 n=1 Tax=Goodea atripinnis TaxID=208336 RepID=A0ABV0MEG3_9TELE